MNGILLNSMQQHNSIDRKHCSKSEKCDNNLVEEISNVDLTKTDKSEKKIYSNRLKKLNSEIGQNNLECSNDKKLSSNFKEDFVYDTKFNENTTSNCLKNLKYNKQVKISDIVSKLKMTLDNVSSRNQKLINKIDVANNNILTMKNLTKDCFLKSYDKNDLLKDIYFEHKIFHYWRSLLKRKHEKENCKNYTSFKDEKVSTNSDDIVCVVCNDGDYEENDLIVYCAVSHILF